MANNQTNKQTNEKANNKNVQQDVLYFLQQSRKLQ